MPRKQIASFDDTASVAATDRLVIQKGTVGAVFENATVTQLFASGVAATHSSVTVTGTAVPTNGIYLPGTNTVGIAVNGTAEAQVTATALSPATSDGLALGTSSLQWSDAFMASGAVLDFANGNVTVTHSSGTLTASGALAVSGPIVQTPSGTISAAGTSQATATALTAQLNVVTSVTSGQGVVLPAFDCDILNRGTVDLLVYPPSGAQIEAFGTDAAVDLAADTGSARFMRISSTLYRVF